jgi:hypothetical protein
VSTIAVADSSGSSGTHNSQPHSVRRATTPGGGVQTAAAEVFGQVGGGQVEQQTDVRHTRLHDQAD